MTEEEKQILNNWAGYGTPKDHIRFFKDSDMIAFAKHYAKQEKSRKKELIDFFNWVEANGEDIFYEKPDKVVSKFLNTEP